MGLGNTGEMAYRCRGNRQWSSIPITDNLFDDLITEVCFADDDGTIDGAGRCPDGSDRQFGPGAAEDDAGHGTHVTGIVTSNGTLGSVGAAPDAGIVSSIKVHMGTRHLAGEASFLLRNCRRHSITSLTIPELGVQVINMSVGGVGYPTVIVTTATGQIT